MTDGQTDGRTDGHRMTAVAVLMHSIVRQKCFQYCLSESLYPENSLRSQIKEPVYVVLNRTYLIKLFKVVWYIV